MNISKKLNKVNIMNLFITLVDHGYEISMWRDENLPSDVLQFLSQEAELSECRDYGYGINPERGGFKILEYVKTLDQDLMKARTGIRKALNKLEIDESELDKCTRVVEQIYEDGVYTQDLSDNMLFICKVLVEDGIIQRVQDENNRKIYIKPIDL